MKLQRSGVTSVLKILPNTLRCLPPLTDAMLLHEEYIWGAGTGWAETRASRTSGDQLSLD